MASTAWMPSCSTAMRCARCIPSSTMTMRAFPSRAGLLQRRGGTVRHDAVAWGYARGADSRGVRHHPALRSDGHPHREGQGGWCRHQPRLHQVQEAGPGPPPAISSEVAAMAGHEAADRKPLCCRPSVSGRPKALHRRRRHLRRRPLLCLAIRQGRPGLRRRHRRLQFLCAARATCRCPSM